MRSDDTNNKLFFQRNRFFYANNRWYFRTREYEDIGPFESLNEAHSALERYIAPKILAKKLKDQIDLLERSMTKYIFSPQQ